MSQEQDRKSVEQNQAAQEPSDSPEVERKEQEAGTAEAAGMAANADAGVEAGPVEGIRQDPVQAGNQPAGADQGQTDVQPSNGQPEAAKPSGDSNADAKPAEAQPAAAADADKEAKRKAAEEARAARAAARAARAAGGEAGKADAAAEGAEAKPKEPSPNQPKLDRLVEILTEALGQDAIEKAWINELGKDMPMVEIKADRWLECAGLLRDHPELKLTYLSNVAGVDMETHMEVVYHLISLETKVMYGFKVKTDRDNPSVPSVTPIWAGANWQEREIYDLLGIDFPGHPDLRRIMLPDDWVGHPLRKDYVPIDPEV